MGIHLLILHAICFELNCNICQKQESLVPISMSGMFPIVLLYITMTQFPSATLLIATGNWVHLRHCLLFVEVFVI